VSLAQLDAFLSHCRSQPELQARLHAGVDLESFLAMAREAGYPLEESDVIAAQQREEETLSDVELQRRAGEERAEPGLAQAARHPRRGDARSHRRGMALAAAHESDSQYGRSAAPGTTSCRNTTSLRHSLTRMA
jgi:predicted ribosomally synthesized peptide with nif11-like leader